MTSYDCPDCNYHVLGILPDDDRAAVDMTRTTLFLSDLIPNDSQEKLLTVDLRTNLSRLGEIDGEMAMLRQRMEALECEKVHVTHVIRCDRNILRTVRRIPPDVLRNIFQAVVNPSNKDKITSSLSFKSTTTAWRLAQVCRIWRDTATSHQPLWTSVRLLGESGDFSDGENGFKRALLLGLQLRRSGTYPLSVALKTDMISATVPVLPVLLSTSFRWRRFFCSAEVPFYSCLSPIRASLDILDHIDISLDSHVDFATVTGSPLSYLLRFAPKLTSVSGDPEVIPLCVLPWSQITTYTETLVPRVNQHNLAVLRAMTNLTTCKIGVYKGDKLLSATVELPKLQSLTIMGDANDVTVILDRLHLPGLTVLTIDGKLSFAGLATYVQAYPSLKKLSIDLQVTPPEADPVINLLTNAQALTVLSLNCSIPLKVLDHIASQPEQVCPFIETLQFKSPARCDPTAEAEAHERLLIARPHLGIRIL
ncbi:hypothetical protein C8J56DRAFT_398054 [Mycena floridula]|nr:hypothetical protein C8J56DRAFT_398054 [Mycena floridula]